MLSTRKQVPALTVKTLHVLLDPVSYPNQEARTKFGGGINFSTFSCWIFLDVGVIFEMLIPLEVPWRMESGLERLGDICEEVRERGGPVKFFA